MNTLKSIVVIILFIGLVPAAIAQNVDKVIMLTGETKEGKVTADSDASIKFVYKGESLEYDIKKSEISKIVFSSGRVHTVNDPIASTRAAIAAPGDRKGKIAVLPVDYTSNEGNTSIESMRQRIQTDVIRSVKENTSTLQVQDPMTTSSLLAKNNIQFEQLTTVAPHDMAVMLGVEYVLYASVSVMNKGSFSYGSGSTIYNNKKTTTDKGNKAITKNTGSDYKIDNSTTMVEYDTHVNLSMYNDQGVNVYIESREAFGSGLDAYLATLKYLIKRCPFGAKAKH